MRERSLVAFTVLGQLAVGMLWGLTAAAWVGGLGVVGVPGAPEALGIPGGLGPSGAVAAPRAVGAPGGPVPSGGWLLVPLLLVGGLLAAAGAAAVLHLGSPRNAWRALSGIRTSWLSRELLLVIVVGAGWAVLMIVTAAGVAGPATRRALLTVVSAAGAALVYAMARVYRLPTVPAWDTRLTTVTFFLAAAATGGLAAALAVSVPGGPAGLGPVRLPACVGVAAVALELGLESLWRRHRDRARAMVDPGLWPDRRPARWIRRGRTLLLAISLLVGLGGVVMIAVGHGSVGMALVPPLLAVAVAAAVAAEVAGRAAFYASHARVGV